MYKNNDIIVINDTPFKCTNITHNGMELGIVIDENIQLPKDIKHVVLYDIDKLYMLVINPKSVIRWKEHLTVNYENKDYIYSDDITIVKSGIRKNEIKILLK